MPIKKQKISCAILGLGFWGKIFLRKLQSHADFDLQAVATSYVDSEIKKHIGSAEIFSQGEDLLKNRDVDFVFILNSVENHFSMAELALRTSKNIFLTKPLTQTLKESEKLQRLAAQARRLIFVDHTFLFNRDFNFLKKTLGAKQILNLSTERMQFGKFQKGSDVLGELLYHDLYMCEDLLGHAMPLSVQAFGECNFGKELDQINLKMTYSKGRTATLFASMNSAEKRKNFRIMTPQKLISWQDMAPSLFAEADYKYDVGVAAELRIKNLEAPKALAKDAIDLMLSHIVSCMQKAERSRVIDIQNGIAIMKIIEAARKSVSQKRSIHL